MAAVSTSYSEKYIIALRIIQPARIQDITEMYHTIWELELTDSLKDIIQSIHQKMRDENYVVSIRKGTYVLDAVGMGIAANLMKERNLDNARMFLMKRQRKSYHKLARRFG